MLGQRVDGIQNKENGLVNTRKKKQMRWKRRKSSNSKVMQRRRNNVQRRISWERWDRHEWKKKKRSKRRSVWECETERRGEIKRSRKFKLGFLLLFFFPPSSPCPVRVLGMSQQCLIIFKKKGTCAAVSQAYAVSRMHPTQARQANCHVRAFLHNTIMNNLKGFKSKQSQSSIHVAHQTDLCVSQLFPFLLLLIEAFLSKKKKGVNCQRYIIQFNPMQLQKIPKIYEPFIN